MTILRHELRQGLRVLAIWTACAGLLLAACIFIFPEMKGEMDAAGAIFASMGGFSAAFGMDRLNFGTLGGFYAVECGAVLSLGGALFATMTGAAALSKEEQRGTADFLLSHPISRARVVAEKLAAVAAQIALMDSALLAVALLAIPAIGEAVPFRQILLLHAAYFLLHIELGCVLFGVSAFLRAGGAGLGIGLASLLYFLNLLSNMAEETRFLKPLTPFSLCDGADLLARGSLDAPLTVLHLALAAAFVLAAFLRYGRKDIL